MSSTTISRYVVRPYDSAGGDSLETRQTEYGPFDTLAEAREFVHRMIGGDFGSFDAPPFDDEDESGLIECWHESDEELCGGYAIYEEAA